MQTVAITDHRSPAAGTATRGSAVPSVARFVAIVMTAAVVALLIAWIVAASLGSAQTVVPASGRTGRRHPTSSARSPAARTDRHRCWHS